MLLAYKPTEAIPPVLLESTVRFATGEAALVALPATVAALVKGG